MGATFCMWVIVILLVHLTWQLSLFDKQASRQENLAPEKDAEHDDLASMENGEASSFAQFPSEAAKPLLCDDGLGELGLRPSTAHLQPPTEEALPANSPPMEHGSTKPASACSPV